MSNWQRTPGHGRPHQDPREAADRAETDDDNNGSPPHPPEEGAEDVLGRFLCDLGFSDADDRSS